MLPSDDETASTAGYIDVNASEPLFLLTYAVFKAAHIATNMFSIELSLSAKLAYSFCQLVLPQCGHAAFR